MVEVNRHYEHHQPPCFWHISAKIISSDVIQLSHRRKLIISAAQEDYCKTICPPVDKFNRCVWKDFLLQRIRYQSRKRGQAPNGNMGGRTAQALLKKKKTHTHTTLVSVKKEEPLCFRKASLWFMSSNCNGSPTSFLQTPHAPDERLVTGRGPSCCQEVADVQNKQPQCDVLPGAQRNQVETCRPWCGINRPARASREAVSEQSKQKHGPRHYRPKVRLK